MNKKYLILAILLAGLVVGFAAKAESPAVSISDFKTSVSTPGTITGSFSLENTGSDLTDVIYYLTLQGKPVPQKIDSEGVELIIQPIVTKYQNPASLELKTNEKEDFTFSLDYPTSIKTGEYQLNLYIRDSLRSAAYDSDLINISLDGDNRMLAVSLDECKVIDKEGKEYPTYEGALFNPGDQPTVKCKISNPTDKPVEFTVNYQTGILNVLTYGNQKIQDSKSQETYSLGANGTKEITLTLLKKTEPNIYETFAQFIEKGTNNVISPYLVFRWTIKGEAARIDKVEVDPFKSNYAKGEKITVTMDYSPSPDLYWRGEDENLGTDLKDVKITLTLYDNNNKSCGQTEKNIDKLSEYVRDDKIDLSVASNCKATQLLTQILKGEKILASYTLNFSTSVPQEVKEIVYLFFAILIIAVLLAIWFISKRKINLIIKIIIIVILIGLVLYLGLLIFTQSAKASSGSFGNKNVSVEHYSRNCWTDTVRLTARIPQYNISDFQQGNDPATATVSMYYKTSSEECDNHGAHIYTTFQIEGKDTVRRVRTDSQEGSEENVPINLLTDIGGDLGFNDLTPGNYNLKVDSRVVIHMGSSSGYQPVSNLESVRYGDSCVYYYGEGSPYTKSEARKKSYQEGWKGSERYSRCGDGKSVCGYNSYSPLVFKIPFTVSAPQTLSVDLTAIPNSGTAPLNDVDLKASVSGTATGTINYKFDCTNNGSWEYTFDGINDNPKTVIDACDYSTAGTYTAKVRVERGAAPAAEDTATITVTAPQTLSVVLTAIPNSGTAPLNDVDLKASVSGTATGTINYKFDCTNNGSWEYTFDGINDNPKTVIDACDYSTAGTYTAKVRVERGAAPAAEDTATITVTPPVAEKPTAGFMCTLTKPAQQTQESWKICNKDNIKPFKGQWVYLKDDPTLTEYSYTAAPEITITNRKWEIVGGEVFSPNPNPPDNNNPNDSNPNNLSPVVKTPIVGDFKIRLTVTDSNGRADDVEHTLWGKLPPPDWIEIPPF